VSFLNRLFGAPKRQTTRAEMDAALKRLVVPELRALGFKGSMPHLRRERAGAFDLLSFQFSKWGGAFAVEIGRFPLAGLQHSWKFVAPEKVKNFDLTDCYRIGARDENSDHWFEFEHAAPDAVARELLQKLPEPHFWDTIAMSHGFGAPDDTASYGES
jgi:hypothetical protein